MGLLVKWLEHTGYYNNDNSAIQCTTAKAVYVYPSVDDYVHLRIELIWNKCSHCARAYAEIMLAGQSLNVMIIMIMMVAVHIC